MGISMIGKTSSHTHSHQLWFGQEISVLFEKWIDGKIAHNRCHNFLPIVLCKYISMEKKIQILTIMSFSFSAIEQEKAETKK